MKIHMIRHGKTTANENKLYCGSTDIGLSEAGKKELIKQKKKISYPRADRYITSGRKRAIQTAEILFGNPVWETAAGLREIDFGMFEMKSHEELKHMAAYREWIGGIEYMPPPMGEAKTDFNQRVKESFYDIRDENHAHGVEETMIVTHGGVIAGLMQHLFPGTRDFFRWQPYFGRGYTILLEEGKPVQYILIK